MRGIAKKASGVVRNIDRNSNFTQEVMRRSGQTLTLCWHCQSCAGGCPFAEAMDFNPNSIIRMVQLGLRKEALECSSIWFCVGCNTCSINCPNAIDIPAVTTILRIMAIEAGARVGEPDILNFHRSFLSSIRRYGRMHELEVMLNCKWQMRNWFDDIGIGLTLLRKGRLKLFPHRCNELQTIRNTYQRCAQG